MNITDVIVVLEYTYPKGLLDIFVIVFHMVPEGAHSISTHDFYQVEPQLLLKALVELFSTNQISIIIQPTLIMENPKIFHDGMPPPPKDSLVSGKLICHLPAGQ